MQELISSSQNSKIKNILSLQKSSERRSQNLFVVEGLREIKLALEASHLLHSIFICKEIIGVAKYSELKQLIKSPIVEYEISKPIFEKIAYRENSDGIIALAVSKVITLENIKLRVNPLIIVLEAIEKPGNIGAILRTADAANVDAVIICNPKTDIYNPNVIRSSVGCLFTNQVVACTTEEAIDWLRKQNISIFPTHLNAKEFYHQVDFKQPSAIIMGTEDRGLSNKWLASDFKQIKIPMNGKIDSMNVSNATAIVIFEAMRQREFKFY
ncbi:MAG: rRNA methyltransferase [Bacteroidetes bacterium CG2_30_32_10]|nr:MAG: rRNA methyltransferase [Bacteroidetes bacterium CG2_30_32_10]